MKRKKRAVEGGTVEGGRVCAECGKVKPPEAFVGVYKARVRTCIDCREARRRRKQRHRVRVDVMAGYELISGRSLLGLSEGLRVRLGRRRPRDRPGEVWWEVV